MAPFLGFIEKQFRHPMVPMFLIFGAVLVLLGITSGISLVGYGELEATGEFRYISVVIGFASISVAMFIYYNPPKLAHEKNRTKHVEIDNTPNWIPEEVLLPWFARRDYLTDSQRKLLTLIEGEKSISLAIIMDNFPDKTYKELFYRLEQLRHLGFIVLEQYENKTDPQNCLYTLSNSYLEETKNRASGITVVKRDDK